MTDAQEIEMASLELNDFLFKIQQEKQMKQVKFKELQKGMEIVVKGGIYGGAIYEVFEVEQGFCVIQAADGDLLALPEVMIATGDVGVYSVVQQEEETPYIKTKYGFTCHEDDEEGINSYLEGLVNRTKVSLESLGLFDTTPKENPLESALRSMGLPPTFAPPYGKVVVGLGQDATPDTLSDEEDVSIPFTPEELHTINAIMGQVRGDTITDDVLDKIEPFIDREYVEELFETVYIQQEEIPEQSFIMPRVPLSMYDNGLVLKIKD